jgi:arginase family enzyme
MASGAAGAARRFVQETKAMDAIAAKTKVRLIGLPTDNHSSFLRGAAGAPAVIRAALASDHRNRATELGGELGFDIKVEDSGDLPLLEDAGDPSRISGAVEASARDGAVPICLGGDHMVTFPIVSGLARVHGPVNILHFDAHRTSTTISKGIRCHTPLPSRGSWKAAWHAASCRSESGR